MPRKKPKPVDNATSPPKQRRNWRLDAETDERLHVHCLKRRIKPAALLTELINEHCRQWHIHQSPKAGTQPGKPTETPE